MYDCKTKVPTQTRLEEWPKNCRPISLLPAVSKSIKKTIQIQTQEYLDKNGSLYQFQSGFRTAFSTDSCVLQLTDFIVKGMDKGFHTGMILGDLHKKVFDTLYHTILLQRVQCIGFKELLVKWFQSYLSNRKFLWH